MGRVDIEAWIGKAVAGIGMQERRIERTGIVERLVTGEMQEGRIGRRRAAIKQRLHLADQRVVGSIAVNCR